MWSHCSRLGILFFAFSQAGVERNQRLSVLEVSISEQLSERNCCNSKKSSLKGAIFIIWQLASSYRQKKGKCIRNSDHLKPFLISSESFKDRVESRPVHQHKFIFICKKCHDYITIFPNKQFIVILWKEYTFCILLDKMSNDLAPALFYEYRNLWEM